MEKYWKITILAVAVLALGVFYLTKPVQSRHTETATFGVIGSGSTGPCALAIIEGVDLASQRACVDVESLDNALRKYGLSEEERNKGHNHITATVYYTTEKWYPDDGHSSPKVDTKFIHVVKIQSIND